MKISQRGILLGILLFCVLSSAVQPVIGGTRIELGIGVQYDTGEGPDIAVNSSGNVVDVHEGSNNYQLYYRVGNVNLMALDWGSSYNYTKGISPSVAVNDSGVVVESHKAEFWNNLYCRVGTINSSEKTISWGSGSEYDDGKNPSIAIDNDGWVVEVHKAQTWDNLWYRVGYVNTSSKTISWGSSHEYDSGVDPYVAMNNNGTILEVHRSEGYNQLYYHVGIIDKNNKTISWGPSHNYDSGNSPSIALTDDGYVLEVHKSEVSADLWQRVGSVNTSSKTISWKHSADYFDDGEDPALAIDSSGKMAVHTHESEGYNTLWYSTSLLTDRKKWMENEYSQIKDKYLWQVTIPGSHDSGAYDMELEHASCSGTSSVPPSLARPYAETHEDDMAGQLADGTRFFDVRPYNKSGTFYTWHSIIGDSMVNVLDDTRSFMESSNHELVILKISHFCDFSSDSDHQALVDLIQSKLGNYLYGNSDISSWDLLTTTIDEYVGNGSKVIINYNNDYIYDNPNDGFWRDIHLYNSYSNTDDYDDMRENQLYKLENYSASSTRLFSLSWTLTPQTSISSIYTSLHDLTYDANRNLGEFIAEYGNAGYQINIVYGDFLSDARATDNVIMLNR